jgi:hypothetical protein
MESAVVYVFVGVRRFHDDVARRNIAASGRIGVLAVSTYPVFQLNKSVFYFIQVIKDFQYHFSGVF